MGCGPGKPQVIDVFDGKIVLRKPVDAKEAEKASRRDGRDDRGNGKKKAKAEV